MPSRFNSWQAGLFWQSLFESLGTAATAGLGIAEPPPGQQPKVTPASLGQQFLGRSSSL